jgi:AbrB family looped-hinge helix DNA binding protein
VPSIYNVKVGKQGRLVLPKRLREEYQLKAGDEAVIITKGAEVSVHFHKAVKDPLQDLIELSKEISIGMTAEEMKKFSEEERFKHYLQTQR